MSEINIEPLKKKRKKSGCLPFFMGFCAAFIFMIVGIGGIGTYIYFCVTVEQITGSLGFQTPLGDFNKMTVNQIINAALKEKDDYINITFDKLDEYNLSIPESFLGVSLGNLYDKTIEFNNETKRLGDIKVLDAANNIEKFIEAVLPKIYETAVVGDVLNALQIDISSFGYPAFTEAIYNVGSDTNKNLKKLEELTVEQALNALPEYYGEDYLTFSKLQTALNLSLIPETDEFKTVLNKTISKITFEDLSNNITIGSIIDIMGEEALGLNNYSFAQTEEFKSTLINDLGEYFETVPLSQIIEIPDISTIENPTTMDKLLNSIKDVTVGELMDGGATELSTIIDKVNLTNLITKTNNNENMLNIIGTTSIANLIFNPEVISEKLLADTRTINEIYPNLTIESKLYDIRNYNFKQVFDNAQSYIDILNNTLFSELIDNNENLMSVIGNITLNQILFSPEEISSTLDANNNTLETILNLTNPNNIIEPTEIEIDLWTIKDETFNSLKIGYNALTKAFDTMKISELTGQTTGIMSIIGEITLGDILTDANCISNALKTSSVTLEEMLELNSEQTTGIIGIIKNLEIKDLFGENPGQAITNLLKTSNDTLANLLNFDTTTSTDNVVNKIMNIAVGSLFTEPAKTFKDTINSIELTDLLNTEGNTLLEAIVKQSDKLGKPVTVNNLAEAINLITLSDMGFTSETGILSLIDSNTTLNNLADTLTDFNLTEQTITELQSAGIFGENENSLFYDTVFDKNSTNHNSSYDNIKLQAFIDYLTDNPKTLSEFIGSLQT